MATTEFFSFVTRDEIKQTIPTGWVELHHTTHYKARHVRDTICRECEQEIG